MGSFQINLQFCWPSPKGVLSTWYISRRWSYLKNFAIFGREKYDAYSNVIPHKYGLPTRLGFIELGAVPSQQLGLTPPLRERNRDQTATRVCFTETLGRGQNRDQTATPPLVEWAFLLPRTVENLSYNACSPSLTEMQCKSEAGRLGAPGLAVGARRQRKRQGDKEAGTADSTRPRQWPQRRGAGRAEREDRGHHTAVGGEERGRRGG